MRVMLARLLGTGSEKARAPRRGGPRRGGGASGALVTVTGAGDVGCRPAVRRPGAPRRARAGRRRPGSARGWPRRRP
ncbi:hypothetical protein DNL40_00445 [Xylanimonas oleitrophica]|uniref:Uncharacterized protein n=1 Tax=Xylanimonas oleitrophica TaxID=2607479 RepID=A0A2W5XWH4_9MICO|nr:hypothetical protein DNL40_00445 [Xylanimonas oleitrophica]